MKPKCKLLGEDGNVFNLLAVVNKTLKANNLHEKAKEMIEKTHQANSYEEALSIIGEYVEIC